jgi:hypothetical protein
MRPLLLLSLLLLTGCGARGPERASVSGKVTLDGKAIEMGSITFVPADGNAGPTAGSAITAGQFDIKKAVGPVLGKHKVELRAWRLTGKQIPNPMSPGAMMDEKVEAFPEQFNNASTLIREIESGHNTFDFELESAAPPP